MTEEEKRAIFLNQRSDKFTIVLNDNELHLFKDTDNVFLQFRTHDAITPIYIAVIKHDRDKADDGHLKTQHYHVVVQFNKVARFGTIINFISDMFKCNTNQITLDKCSSLCMQSRYLLHADDFDKEPYYVTEVRCNDMDCFNRYLSLVIVRDLHDLIKVVKTYHYNLEDIMQNVGHYDKWRKYINDLIVDHNRRRI